MPRASRRAIGLCVGHGRRVISARRVNFTLLADLSFEGGDFSASRGVLALNNWTYLGKFSGCVMHQ
jgi:hypothetical protein